MNIINPRLQNICDILRVKPDNWVSMKLTYEQGKIPYVGILKEDDTSYRTLREIDLEDFADIATFFLKAVFFIGNDRKSLFESHRRIMSMTMEIPTDVARITFEDDTLPVYFGKFHSDLLRSGLHLSGTLENV